MKKIILSLLALPMLFACSNEAEQTPQEAGRVPLQIELGGITRATVLDALPAECTYGVFATTSNLTTTSALADDGANRRVTYVNGKSTFDVPVFIPEGGSIFVRAYYPYNASLTQYAISNGIPLDTKSQTDYLITTSSYVATESSPTVKLTMQHAMARIHVTINKAASNASSYIFKEIALSNVLMQGTYGFNGSVSIDDPVGTITAYPTNIYLNEATDNIEADFLVLPISWSRVMQVSLPNSGYDHLTTALPSRSYVAGQQYNITLTINHKSELEAGEWTIVPWDSQYKGGLSIWKDDKTGGTEVTPTPQPQKGTHEGHEYVDLGLPSGTLWATTNVGATLATEKGDYYAWGETETKPEFMWYYYKLCNGNFTSLKKYNTDSTFGSVDNLTVLEEADDVAHVKWGGNWRMPTLADIDELIAYCKFEWDGLGSKAIGPNGNYIYLGSIGWTANAISKSDGITNEYDYRAFWWTSTLSTNSTSIRAHALSMNYTTGVVKMTNFAPIRAIGCGVRPVMSKH